MSKKKVTAPTTYNPGSGHPKEYLAYLNWQEMQALQRLNGNGPRRGPKGIPSFADDSASSLGNERPPESPYSGYQGGGDGGFSGNNYSDAGSESGGGGYGGGDYGGGGSSYSGSSTGAYQSSRDTAASPESPSPSQQQSPDTAAQNAAEVNNAKEASLSSALMDDARRGGISSINVGPMQTPVAIGGGQIHDALSEVASYSYRPVTPTSPGAGGGFGSLDTRRSSLLSPVGPSSGTEAFGNVGPSRISPLGSYPGFGSSTDLKLPTSYPDAPSGTFGPISPIKTYYPDAPQGSFGPRISSPTSRRPTDPDLSPYTQPSNMWMSEPGGISALGFSRIEPLKQAIGDAYKAIGNYFSPETPSGGVAGLGGIPSLEIANKSPDVKNDISMSVIGGLGMPATTGSAQSQKISPFTNPELRNIAYGSPDFGKIGFVAGKYDSPIGPTAIGDRTNPFAKYASDSLPPGYREKYLGTEIMVEDVPPEAPAAPAGSIAIPSQEEDIVNQVKPAVPYGPIYVDQKIQEVMRRYDEINDKIVGGGIGLAKGVVGAFTGGLGSLALSGVEKGLDYFTGRDFSETITDPASSARRSLMQARTDEERQQILSDNPQLVPFARQAGVDVTDENMQDWQNQRIASGVIPKGMPIPGYGGSAYQGGAPIRELGGKQSYETAYNPTSPSYPSGATPAPEESTGRPYQYYLWDLGVGIPSPGDPDYNDYQEYLAGREPSART